MAQGTDDLDSLVRKRLRGLRLAQGRSLQELADAVHMSQSTLSRIENGQRRLTLDQMVMLARALDTSLDQLVDSPTEAAVVRSATADHAHRSLAWSMQRDPDIIVQRLTLTAPPPPAPSMRAHSGSEWIVVLSGTVTLLVGTRRYRVETNQSAEFSTMLPHAFGVETGTADVLAIFDREARRGHGRGAEQDAPDENS